MRLYTWKFIATAHIRYRLGYGSDGRDPLVLLFPKYKIAYVPVPKAANSSIRAALLPLLDIDPAVVPNIYQFDGFIERRVSQCPNLPNSDWFVFTVVRDPYARAASAFLDKVVIRDPVLRAFRRMGVRKGDSFTDYLKIVSLWPRLSLNNHILPQTDLLFRFLGSPNFKVIKLEELGTEWPTIRAELEARSGKRLPDLERRNVAKSERPWPSLYDQRSRRMVESIYSSDFEILGYASQSPGGGVEHGGRIRRRI